MLKCTFIVIYVFSFVLSEKCLTGFTNLVIMLDNNHRSSTCRASLFRATVAVSETILVTLSTYRAVPALRTSLLVVSAHLHSRGWGVSEAGIGNPNLRKLPLFAHSHVSRERGRTLNMGSSSGFRILYEDRTRRHEAKIR